MSIFLYFSGDNCVYNIIHPGLNNDIKYGSKIDFEINHADIYELDVFIDNRNIYNIIFDEYSFKNDYLIYKENSPRYNSLKWYLSIIGLDFSDVINRINKIPRLY